MTDGAPLTPPAWVARGRDILRVAVWVTASLSLALTATVVVLAALGVEPGNGVVDGPEQWMTDTALLTAPVLFVIALNLLIWRALLPGLVRRTRPEAIALVVVIALGLAVASWFAVAVLLLGGFVVFGIIGDGFA